MIPALLGLALAAGQASDPLVGTWRGTSTCTVRPSPCNDEIAVYYVTRTGPGRYHMLMHKVVGGVEGPMGELDLTDDRAAHRLSATTFDRQKRPGTWTFALDGDRMHGTLVVVGQRYRVIELRRDSHWAIRAL